MPVPVGHIQCCETLPALLQSNTWALQQARCDSWHVLQGEMHMRSFLRDFS